jgi:hypothetical protein
MKHRHLATATLTLVLGTTTALAKSLPVAPQQITMSLQTEHGIDKLQRTRDLNAPLPARIESNEHHHVALQSLASVQATPCNVNDFATSNSNTLINEIKTQGSTCVNDLFSASSSTQYYAFSSDNMYAVANHTNSLASSYSGNGDPDLEALYLFLRAGYYAEFYNNSISFSSWVKPAVKGAIDSFVNNSNFYNNNDAHGKVLQEVIIAMDSTEQQDVYEGHFEREGMVVYKDMTLNFDKQLYVRQLKELDEPNRKQVYDIIDISKDSKIFVHQIQKAPSYDQLLHIDQRSSCLSTIYTRDSVPDEKQTLMRFLNCGTLKPLYFETQDFKAKPKSAF